MTKDVNLHVPGLKLIILNISFCRLILRGYRKPITKEDTFPLESKDKADHLFSNFKRNWEKSDRNVKEL